MLKRMAAICSAVAMVILSISGTVFAEEPKDTSGHLVVEYYDNGKPLTDVEFRVHRVGTLEYGKIQYEGLFSGYRLSAEMTDTLPTLVADYAMRDGIPADSIQKTNETGTCRFDGLADGLYLVSGPETKQAVSGMNSTEGFVGSRETTCRPQPLLVEISVGKTLIVEPKLLMNQVTDPGATTNTLSVVKVWEQEDGQAAEHPEKITVDLLENGEIKETVELNAENEWSHTWTLPATDHTWSVVESAVPEGYELSSELVSDTVILTNTKTTPKAATPDEIDSPTNLPDNTDKKQNPSTETNKKTLPQTGMLRYPILLLIAGSVIVAAVGIICLRKAGKKDE